MVRRGGHEGVEAKNREAERLLGDLGRRAGGRRAGRGRETKTTREGGRGRHREWRDSGKLGDGESDKKGGRTYGAPPPDPRAARSIHANPPCVDDPCCIIPRTQPPHRRRTRSVGCDRPGVTRKGASAPRAGTARSRNGVAT